MHISLKLEFKNVPVEKEMVTSQVSRNNILCFNKDGEPINTSTCVKRTIFGKEAQEYTIKLGDGGMWFNNDLVVLLLRGEGNFKSPTACMLKTIDIFFTTFPEFVGYDYDFIEMDVYWN